MIRLSHSKAMMERTGISLFLFIVAIFSGFRSFAVATPKDKAVVAVDSEFRSFDPRYSLDANSQYLDNLVHCSLIDFNKNGSSIPSLAKGLPVWQDSSSLLVTIKPQIKFSDGTVVDADDVKATYEFFLQEKLKNPSPKKGAFANIASIKKISSEKILFKLKKPDATFVSNLIVGILPKEKAQLDGALGSDSKTPGCGAFVVSKVSVGEVRLDKNKHFNLSNGPKLNGIIFKIVKDEKTRLNKLKAGEIDIVQNILSPNSLKKIETGSKKLKVLRNAGLKTTYLAFNMRDKITSNANVRKAISLAINKKQIIDMVLVGFAVEAESMLTPNDPFYNKSLSRTEQNIKKANELLDKAGFKAPKGKKYRFEISYKTTTNTTRQQIARAVSDQLRKVGIKVNVESMEWGRFKKDVEEGKAQVWSLSWVGFKDPDIYRYAFATESAPPNGGNRGFYSNKKLDLLLEQGRSTIDLAKRKIIYNEIQQIVANELPYVFLWHEENFAAFSKNLNGFEIYADGRYSSLLNAFKN